MNDFYEWEEDMKPVIMDKDNNPKYRVYVIVTVVALVLSFAWFNCSGQVSYADTALLRYDTSKVIMLVSNVGKIAITEESFQIDWDATKKRLDTLKSDSVSSYMMIGKFVIDTTWVEPINKVTWQYGYEVKYADGYGEDAMWRREPLTKTVTYLDADKKPLPKNIVVWQTKQLN